MSTAWRGFDNTRWSLVRRADGAPTKESRKALEELCRAYRPPLLAFARRLEVDPDRAEDLVQSFFTHVVEQNVVGAADPEKGRFRNFLRAALRNHALTLYHARMAKKRGGGARTVDADEIELPSEAPSSDRLYDRLWTRTLFERALARLGEEERRAGRGERFEALRDRLMDEDDAAPLRETALRLNKNVGTVKVELHRLRLRHIAVLRAEVAETVDGPEQVDQELRDLLAAWNEDT